MLLAILLHDIGWAVVDQERDLPRRLRDGDDGVRRADRSTRRRARGSPREALGGAWDPAVVEEVAAIIDGHDSRRDALSRNDELVKDADKLWRYSVTGVGVAATGSP